MHILGIHDGHTSTACLLTGGAVRANASEERFTKKKGQGGFPHETLRYIFDEFQLSVKDVEYVALVGLVKPLTSIKQYETGRQQLFPKLIKLFPGDPRNLIQRYVAFNKPKRLQDAVLLAAFKKAGIDLGKVVPVEHHQCHAATAYYLSKFYQNSEPVLVITLDGSGDGLSGTVSVVDAAGKWQRLREISTFDSLGMLFGRTTQLLSMKPWEHEYKLMGMAPYVHEDYRQRALTLFNKYIGLTHDGLGLQNKTKLWGNSLLGQMREDFKTTRFDAVAAGVQLLHEKLVTELVSNWIKKTGIRKVAAAGGCFMNIKANKLILELENCDDLFVMPSGGDESCALGAALTVAAEKNKNFKAVPLSDIYWGPAVKQEAITQTLGKYSKQLDYRISENIELESAKLLAEHKIIGRVSGRMEWGARALGNRSILANPSRFDNIRKLNNAIKMRDFWMPFAPSILWEMRKEYAVYPKESDAYLMTLGFDSTALAQQHLIASLHPYDLTMRPQFVRKDYNPRYHALLSHFKELTGIGGVLNTSFNLHGLPIVNDTEDAVYTLLNSELDYITVNDYLIWKKEKTA